MGAVQCTECGQIDFCGDPRKVALWCDFCKKITVWKKAKLKKIGRATLVEEKQFEFFKLSSR